MMDALDGGQDDDFGSPVPPGSEALSDDIVRGLAADAGLDEPADDGSSRAGVDSYWSISRTPLTSLVFTMPLVLAYEGGVLLMGRGSPRNGADVWLRQLLDAAGFGAYFLLPALTVIGLLAWHHVEHDRWRVRPGILAGMALESLIWAAALLGLARLQGRWWPLAAALEGEGLFARFVAFCGAGLYEEVLFRLLLLPAVAWLMSQLGCSTLASACWGVVASSVLFSLAHYIGPLGDAFTLYSFTFRFLAGLFFAILFVARGFGIAAGTHAVYDILVGLV